MEGKIKMKSLKIAKYEFFEILQSMKVYYAIVMAVYTLLTIVSLKTNGETTSSGLEFSTIVFLFIAGLNSVKGSFKFSLGNNITRKTFFKGLVLSSLPIGALMAVLDIILNRIYNLFVDCPTIYDMIYQKAFGTSIWTQSNSIGTLFSTGFFLVFLYSMIFVLGIFVNMLYYRSNKVLKVVISVVPFVLLMFFSNANQQLVPQSFWSSFGNFLSKVFGIESHNSYMASFSFIVIAAGISGLIYLLGRRAIIKD